MTQDSRIIGNYIGDLVGEDDLGDLIGDLELGRRMRRGQRRRAHRGLARMGISREDLAAVRSNARRTELQSLSDQALADNEQLTAGHYVADGGQRTLYLPFAAPVLIGAPAGSAGRLQVTVQRPMSVRRIILRATDTTTGADALGSLDVTNISIGVQPVFNAPGSAPASAFESRAVGNNLETMVARVGVQITIDLVREFLVANACSVSGYLIGVSAEH